MTMEVRPGRGLPMDSKVFLPMMTWWPKVVFLKCCKSPDNFHTSWLSFPMTLLRAFATIRDSFTIPDLHQVRGVRTSTKNDLEDRCFDLQGCTPIQISCSEYLWH